MNDISKIYDEVLNDYKNMRTGRIRRQIRNIADLVGQLEGKKLLEVGVATGKYTSMFTKHNSVVALDLSRDNLDRCKNAVGEMGNIDNLECIVADCSKIPFNKGVFDVVTAIDMIEHIADEVFSSLCFEANRVLVKGGSFYIYTPNLLHPYELSRPFRPVMRKEHIGVRTRAKICRFLTDAGFEIERKYFNNCFRRISIKAKKV